MKRIIKVIATYGLDDPELKRFKTTPKETVKEMVERDMVKHFGYDEGYLGIEVEVIDI
jgi:hypothetical protein